MLHPVKWLRIARANRLLVVLAVAAALFLGLTLVARQAAPDEVDVQATRWFQQWANPALTWFMQALSWFGYSPQSYFMPIAVAGAFALRGLRAEALWVLGSQIAPLANVALKALILRPRPTAELVTQFAVPETASFPSGHVVQYASLLGFAFFLVYVLARESRWRSALLVALGLLVALVGPSRIYLGQHWLSDVLAGYAVATLWLVPYWWAYSRLRLRSRLPA